jgi:hypothetical protein
MSRASDLARKLLELDEYDLKIVLDAADEVNNEVIDILENSIEEEI